MAFKILDDMDFAGRTALVRVDLNVPVAEGQVSDTTRITRLLPTITHICEAGGKVVLLAHFGRPKGRPDPAMSLAVVRPALEAALGKSVAFAENCIGGAAKRVVAALEDGAVALLENTRFHEGEEKNDKLFAASLAALGDIYVNDAFSAAHRAHASTEGLAHLLPACAGRLMEAELKALEAALDAPARPVAAVVGGAKVSTKLELLSNLITRVDHLIIGGGMANTFLVAKGLEIGTSLAEREMTDTAREIMAQAEGSGCTLHLPVDIVVAREFAAGAAHDTLPVGDCAADAMILDAGPQTVAAIADILRACRTLVWNGPLGAFELPPFDAATVAAAQEAAHLTEAGALISVAGGGDTVAALNKAGVAEAFTYVSTAGGAFLEWMEGKTLPGVAALDRE